MRQPFTRCIMQDTPFNLDAYRRRIGLEGPVAPTLETLSRVVARHARAIAFENIEVLAGRVPALDGEALQRKMLSARRGGYCFEQNSLLREALMAMGFTVRRLEARVRAGVPADVHTGRTHMALRVTLEGDDHLVDVGFGSQAPTAPLRLVPDVEQPAGSGRYRFVAHDGEMLLQAQGPDGWADCYRLAAREPLPVDLEIANWYVATHPRAMLRHNVLLGRAVEGGRLRLFNRTLSVFRPETAAPEVQQLQSRAEFADVLAEGFGLEVQPGDLDAVMDVLARQDAAGA